MPSQASVYPNGKFFLFSGLAHSAFQRLDVPFPGWAQPDFRQLNENRAGFLTFLNEVRAFFVAPRATRPENPRSRTAGRNNEAQNREINLNTILQLQPEGSAKLSGTIDIFIGVNLKRILTQIFSTVFDLRDELVISSRERQSGRTVGGAAAGSSIGERLNGGAFSTFNPISSGGLGDSRKNYFHELEQTQFLAPLPLFDGEQKNLVRTWRRQIVENLTNPATIFIILIATMLAFAWRLWRAAA